MDSQEKQPRLIHHILYNALKFINGHEMYLILDLSSDYSMSTVHSKTMQQSIKTHGTLKRNHLDDHCGHH